MSDELVDETTEVSDPREGTLPVRLVVALLVVILGATVLLSSLLSDDPGDEARDQVPGSAVWAGDIAVYGAYAREPVTDTAAAYFVMTNTGDEADVLTSVSTPVAAAAMLHDVGKAPATAAPGEPQLGAESMTPTPDVVVEPGQTITLEPTAGHVMLEQLSGTLAPGSTINLHLVFEKAGTVTVKTKVIGLSDPVPTP